MGLRALQKTVDDFATFQGGFQNLQPPNWPTPVETCDGGDGAKPPRLAVHLAHNLDIAVRTAVVLGGDVRAGTLQGARTTWLRGLLDGETVEDHQGLRSVAGAYTLIMGCNMKPLSSHPVF